MTGNYTLKQLIDLEESGELDIQIEDVDFAIEAVEYKYLQDTLVSDLVSIIRSVKTGLESLGLEVDDEEVMKMIIVYNTLSNPPRVTVGLNRVTDYEEFYKNAKDNRSQLEDLISASTDNEFKVQFLVQEISTHIIDDFVDRPDVDFDLDGEFVLNNVDDSINEFIYRALIIIYDHVGETPIPVICTYADELGYRFSTTGELV